MTKVKLPSKALKGPFKQITQKLKYVEDPFDPTTLGKMKPNSWYKTGKAGSKTKYRYETDAKGRITKAEASPLKLSETERLRHASNPAGKQPGDHAGHLFGDRFDGSANLDNIVAQNPKINLSDYKKLENDWAKRLHADPNARIDVKIDVQYGPGARPTGFKVTEIIDGGRPRTYHFTQ